MFVSSLRISRTGNERCDNHHEAIKVLGEAIAWLETTVLGDQTVELEVTLQVPYAESKRCED